MALFAREADRMQRDGLDQWQSGIYPLTEHIEADIRSGYGWGVASRGDVLAYLSIDDTPGPFYDAANLTWKTPREGRREHE